MLSLFDLETIPEELRHLIVRDIPAIVHRFYQNADCLSQLRHLLSEIADLIFAMALDARFDGIADIDFLSLAGSPGVNDLHDCPSTMTANLLSEVLVTYKTFDIDSDEGQRGRPSGLMRFDTLNAVGSRPALRARPEVLSPFSRAS